MSILDEIFAHKRSEVNERRAAVPLAEVRQAALGMPAPHDFVAALRRCGAATGRPALIAEVKSRSPSRGKLAINFDPLGLAQLYAANGAAAISVLADERFFGGSLEHLRLIARSLGGHPPLLCKDFTFDPYQVYEARAAGADAILLIAAHLPEALLVELQALADALGMAALVEAHTEDELDLALRCAPALIGINNRNLHDFSVDLGTTLSLSQKVPRGGGADITLVAESGIQSAGDVARLAQAGIDAMLVGEALVTAPGVAARVREFRCRSTCPPGRRWPRRPRPQTTRCHTRWSSTARTTISPRPRAAW